MRTSDVQFCITIVDRQLGLLSIIRRWEAPRVVLLCRYRQTSPWVSIAYLHIYIYVYLWLYLYRALRLLCVHRSGFRSNKDFSGTRIHTINSMQVWLQRQYDKHTHF